MKGAEFAVYNHYTKTLQIAQYKQEIPLQLKKYGSAYYNIVPIKNGVAVIGLLNKLNAPKAVSELKSTASQVSFSLYEGGDMLIYCNKHPKLITVNNKVFTNFTFENNRLILKLNKKFKSPKIKILF